MEENRKSWHIYRDMKERTGGELYIGVVGPVRTGKSTLIKGFMEQLVLPHIEDEHVQKRMVDELPQSSSGATIMTTEPKFVPNQAVEVELTPEFSARVRLIDCVGYLADGAQGAAEDGKERMVTTPWFDYEIPFSKAAGIGTSKVITQHANVGVVVTTDGTIGTLTHQQVKSAEELTVSQLKELHKPFVIIVNSTHPDSRECVELAAQLEETYQVAVLPMNCEALSLTDISRMMEGLLGEFPVTKICVNFPKWIEMLPTSHPMKQEILELLRRLLDQCGSIRDCKSLELPKDQEYQYVDQIRTDGVSLSDGVVQLYFPVNETHYYHTISELIHCSIHNEYELVERMREYAQMKEEYEKIKHAIEDVRKTGYGVVAPTREQVHLEEPEIIRSGGRFGVKIRATAPSIHFIQTDVSTEISPIVGDEAQANDLIAFIRQNQEKGQDGVWETSIFGKTIGQIVEDGLDTQIGQLSEDTRNHLQDALQKITNESARRLICILI